MVVPRPRNHVELTSSMDLEDSLAADLMIGCDKDLSEENLRERLHLRKLHDHGPGNGVEHIDQSVLDDCLLGTDRKDMLAEIAAERKKESTRKARSIQINDLVAQVKAKLKKNRRPPCKVKQTVGKNEKKDKRWWRSLYFYTIL